MNAGIYFMLLINYGLTEGTPILSPSEVAYVCPEMNLTLNCSTYENQFLEWTIIVSHWSNSRLVSATGVANQVQPPVINATHFHISRISAENATMPLVSSMLITNALNNSVVNCSGIGTNGVKTETSTTRIYISGGVPSMPHVVYEHQFESDTVTVTGELILLEMGASFDISISPHTGVQLIETTTVQFSLAYNVQYQVNIVATLCGKESIPNITTFLYPKCGYPFTTDAMISITQYTEPATEGSIVLFGCPSGLVLTGPNSSICMQNGEWEPDPDLTKCNVNCNVPVLNCHIGLDYNSTLEGSLLAFWCEDGFIPRGVITAECHSNASWIPDPTQHVCATPQSANCGPPASPTNGYIIPYTSTVEGARVVTVCSSSSGENIPRISFCNPLGDWVLNPANICSKGQEFSLLSHDAVIAVASSVSTFVVSSILFLVIGLLCRCLCKTKISSDKTVSSLPNVIYEDVGPKSVEHQNNVELKENMAYTSVY